MAPVGPDLSIYSIQEAIDHGNFGCVSKYVLNKDGIQSGDIPRSMAVKRIPMRDESDCKREIDMCSLAHKNTVKFFGIEFKDNILHIKMELARCNLNGFRKDHFDGPLDYIPEFAHLALQILEGLEYIHELDIAHRDIKPQNILAFWSGDVAINRSSIPIVVLKLCDFGLSRSLPKGSDGSTTALGTLNYMAPEVKASFDKRTKFKGDCKLADVYSCGLVLIELMVKRIPKRIRRWKSWSPHPAFSNLLASMVALTFGERKSAKCLVETMNHEVYTRLVQCNELCSKLEHQLAKKEEEASDLKSNLIKHQQYTEKEITEKDRQILVLRIANQQLNHQIKLNKVISDITKTSLETRNKEQKQQLKEDKAESERKVTELESIICQQKELILKEKKKVKPGTGIFLNKQCLQSRETTFKSLRHYGSVSKRKHVMIMMVGKSGAGKTQTIQHLTCHIRNIVLFGTLHSPNSKTCETVEYILKMKSEDPEDDINNITVGMVDTPGLDDTGVQQDARNMESIKEFICNHKYLRTGIIGKQTRIYPQVVLFILNGADKQLIGEDTQLARGLRNLQCLMLTDWNNLVIVVTHALSIDNNNTTWADTASSLVIDIQKFVKEKIGKKIPVVLIENSFNQKRMRKMRNAWTELPDKKTLQPLNLFHVLQDDILAKKGDTIGRSAIRYFFSSTEHGSQISIIRGRAVAALDPTRAKTRGSNEQLHESYNQTFLGYREPHNFSDDDSEMEERGSDLDSMKTNSDNNGGTPSASQLERDIEGEDFVIGRCFSMKDGKMLREQIFRRDCIKAGIETMTFTSTTSTTDGTAREEIVDSDREGELEEVGAEGNKESTTKKMMQLNCRTWKLRVACFRVRPKQIFTKEWHNQKNLDISFVAELKKLPKKFHVLKRESYEWFFSMYGVGFVCNAYMGGEARVTSNFHKSDSSDYSRDPKDSAGTAGVPGRSLSDTLRTLGIQTSQRFNSLNIDNYNYQLSFQGGRKEFQADHTADEWKNSVAENPSAIFVLDTDEDIVLYHNFIQKLPWLNQSSAVASALKEAYEEFYDDGKIEATIKDDKTDDGFLASIFKTMGFKS